MFDCLCGWAVYVLEDTSRLGGNAASITVYLLVLVDFAISSFQDFGSAVVALPASYCALVQIAAAVNSALGHEVPHPYGRSFSDMFSDTNLSPSTASPERSGLEGGDQSVAQQVGMKLDINLRPSPRKAMFNFETVEIGPSLQGPNKQDQYEYEYTLWEIFKIRIHFSTY